MRSFALKKKEREILICLPWDFQKVFHSLDQFNHCLHFQLMFSTLKNNVSDSDLYQLGVQIL